MISLDASAPRVCDAGPRQLAVAAATLVGVYLAVFGPGVLTSIRVLAGMAAPGPATAWMDRVASLEWDVFSVAVVLVVVMRWLPRRAPLVTGRMRLGRGSAARFPVGLLGASAAYVAVVIASTWLSDLVVSAGHLAQGGYTQLGRGGGAFAVAAAAATAAGFTEEITLVALAAAVVEQAFAVRVRRTRWVVPATLAALVVARWLVHLYYLWGSAFVLVWVPGAYVIYRWVGSVWPLVLGHWCYDWLALAGRAFPGLSRQFDTALRVLAAVGAVVTVVGTGRLVARRLAVAQVKRLRRSPGAATTSRAEEA